MNNNQILNEWDIVDDFVPGPINSSESLVTGIEEMFMEDKSVINRR